MKDQNVFFRGEDISKSFGGIKALNGVNLTIKKQEVHALVGENGAGKSTLMNVICGILQPEQGQLYVRDRKVKFDQPDKAREEGINIVFQEINLVPALSVAENIFINMIPKRNALGFMSWDDLFAKTEKLLNRLGFDVSSRAIVRDLSLPQKQLVQIARAMVGEPQLIIMDEPTACLPEKETKDLYGIIDELKSAGHSVIYISHKLEEVFHVADQITVLRDGELIKSLKKQETNKDEIIALMVGRSLDSRFPKRAPIDKNTVFEIQGFSKSKHFKDISFNLRKGEIVGFYGLVGSGRTELACSIIGYLTPESGKMNVGGKPVKIKSPKQAISHRIGYLSEDRKNISMLPNFSIKENITISSLKKYARFGFINQHQEKKSATDFFNKLKINANSLNQNITSLSGGNQQKAFLARIIAFDPQIMILDEPTIGIDVGAKYEIYALMDQLTKKGTSIILISSELPEILGMSDRICVMRSGEISGVFNRADADQEVLLRAASHFDS
jgi:ABC-type sugar transport system ATPase subunit